MDPLQSRLTRAVEGRYLVEQELGRGGMAVLFLGQDLRLDRRIAIKVFEKEEGVISAGERFLREMRVAARLQHPNILPVFESGEGEGLMYYVMPYVAGGSLRERLERDGPLPVAEAIRIAREVAEALDHAHRAGIVHRDIKPDNIMLADGSAVVADFGIAKAIEHEGGRLTDTGLAIGSPTYMSPEQAAASPQVDGRTDIYALGCVLYEMLAGSPPFGGTTAQQVMARHATDPPPPLSSVRNLPGGLEAAVTKALAKLPADRWPTGRAFADALSLAITSPGEPSIRSPRRVALWAGAVALVAMASFLAFNRGVGSGPPEPPAASGESIPSIAILPFVFIGDSSQSHFAAGLTEAVITALVNIGGVNVPGQSTVSRYQGRGQDPVAVGRELQVSNVLTASVQVAGPTLRIQPRMVRVGDGLVAWSATLEGEIANIFAMQDSLTQRIVSALRVRLTPASRSVLSRGVGTQNEEAYNLYMLGRSFWLRSDPTSLRRAAEYFNRALILDSVYPAPLVGLLDTYDLLDNVDPGRARTGEPSPGDLIRRVFALDSTNGAAWQYLALRREQACDSAGSERAWEAALRFSPGSSEIRRNYSQVLAGRGRRQEALEMALEAARRDPTSPWVLAYLAWSYVLVGHHDSALAVSERTVQLDTTQFVPRAVRGAALLGAGRAADAVAELEASRRLGGAAHSLSTGVLGVAYARAGRREDARRIARVLGESTRRGEAARTHVASIYVALGDLDQAFAWLAQPPQKSDLATGNNLWLHYLDPIRSDPRFAPLASRRWCAPGV